MKLLKPTLGIAVCSAAIVAASAWNQVERESPGAISLVHQRIPELQEAGCAACHGGWFQGMTSSCLECHGEIEAQREQRSGLHGVLPLERTENCALCHGEHHGDTFALVNAQSFAMVGVADVAAFDHGRIGFAMDGAHLQLECTACHVHAEAEVLPEGAKRYLGLQQDCATCHQDPHEGKMARACAQCHTQERFDLLQAPFHDAVLPFEGGHAAADCIQCHETEGPHSVVTLGQPGHRASRTCRDCHDSPHAVEFLWSLAAAAPAGEVDLASAQACGVCHEVAHRSFAEARGTMTPQRHAASSMPLIAPHAELECSACHGAETDAFAQRFTGRRGDDCAACHESPHGAQFDTGGSAACVDCHGREQFAPHSFGPELHAQRGLVLEHAHDLECAACHTATGDGIRQFRGIGRRCDDCHADAHRGGFSAHGGALGEVAAGSCAQCHTPTEFAATKKFDHARWTGFEVAGAHLEAGCESCHPRAAAADELGRRFGFVAEHFGTFEGCATCHADPHGSQFARGEGDAATTDCARCHDATSFRSLAQPFDHGVETGFALRGAHASAACSSCHAPLPGAEPGHRSAARAAGAACADCHDDPHGGQFAGPAGAEGSPVRGADCAHCHTDGGDWRDLLFRHGQHTRFPLSDAHRALACAACHKPETIGGRLTARYRPVDRSCTACHGAQTDPLRRRGGR